MRSHSKFVICCTIAGCALSFSQHVMSQCSVKDEIALTPEKSGGIYYAYPVTRDSMPELPKGYSPFLISHYGRHGSRWLIKEWQYSAVLRHLEKAREMGVITKTGIETYEKVLELAHKAKGKAGALSQIGEKQHREIAERLFSRFPSLFSPGTRLNALSSTEPRCILSMAAFCERLKELQPSLSIHRSADPGNMDFISFSTPAAKDFCSDSAYWQNGFRMFRDSVVKAARLTKAVLGYEDNSPSGLYFMKNLHDIAVSTQNVDPTCHLLSLFTDDELFDLWQSLNYSMYVKHAYASISNGLGPSCAASLLSHFIVEADSAVDAHKKDPLSSRVTLRFGHDSALIRLMALMHINGFATSESVPQNYCEAWQDFRAAPMAANIQLILFANESGHIIAMLRHNESPVGFPIQSFDTEGLLYDWDSLRNYWTGILASCAE